MGNYTVFGCSASNNIVFFCYESEGKASLQIFTANPWLGDMGNIHLTNIKYINPLLWFLDLDHRTLNSILNLNELNCFEWSKETVVKCKPKILYRGIKVIISLVTNRNRHCEKNLMSYTHCCHILLLDRIKLLGYWCLELFPK